MNDTVTEKSTGVLTIGILEILGGILVIALSLVVAASDLANLWGIIIGIIMIISGSGMIRMLEWARILSIILCLLLFLSGFACLFTAMRPLPLSDRLYGGGPSDNVVFVTSIILMAVGYTGVHLLTKYKDKFTKE